MNEMALLFLGLWVISLGGMVAFGWLFVCADRETESALQRNIETLDDYQRMVLLNKSLTAQNYHLRWEISRLNAGGAVPPPEERKIEDEDEVRGRETPPEPPPRRRRRVRPEDEADWWKTGGTPFNDDNEGGVL